MVFPSALVSRYYPISDYKMIDQQLDLNNCNILLVALRWTNFNDTYFLFSLTLFLSDTNKFHLGRYKFIMEYFEFPQDLTNFLNNPGLHQVVCSKQTVKLLSLYRYKIAIRR